MLTLFGEDNFQEKMDTVVAKWLKKSLEESYIQSFDGTKLYVTWAIHPQESASVVISHGFCEFFAKYHEMAYYFYEMGYSVFFVEYRGHGLSERKVADESLVYVRDFDEYVEDLHALMEQTVTKKSKTGHYYLFAHSMGGAIGTLFMEKYPDYFEKAVLSAPMMEVNFGKMPVALVTPYLALTGLLKWDEKYALGQHPFDGVAKYATSSTFSKPRYDYVFRFREQQKEYRTYAACYAWTRAAYRATKKLRRQAEKLQTPILLFQAGLDTLVKPKGQDIFAKKAKNVIKICFPQSKHEIFNATMPVREKYYHILFSFLENEDKQ